MKGLLDSGALISAIGRGALDTLAKLNLKAKRFKNVIHTAAGDKQAITGFVDVDVVYTGQEKRIRMFIA